MHSYHHAVFALAMMIPLAIETAWAQVAPEAVGLEQAQREAVGRLEDEQRKYRELRVPLAAPDRFELQRRLDQQRRTQQYLQQRQLGESLARERRRSRQPPAIGRIPPGPGFQEYRRQQELLDLQLRLQRRSWGYDRRGE